MRPHLHHNGVEWRYGPRRLSGRSKSVREHLKQRDLERSPTLQKISSRTIIYNRPQVKTLAQKLEDVVEQHLKENLYGPPPLRGTDCVRASSDISSWKESSEWIVMEDIKTKKIVEFTLDFWFISYT